MIPSGRAAELHERQVAVIFKLGRPHLRVEMAGVTADILTDVRDIDRLARRVPLGRIVTPGLPGMHRNHNAAPLGVADFVEPAMPRQQPGKERFEPRAKGLAFAGSDSALPQRPDDCRGHRRLGDARGWGFPAAAPYGWAGEIARVVLPEDDV